MSEFLQLDHIPYNDKIWLAIKAIDIDILQHWSLNCAEFVADNYNKEYPNDDRINNCLRVTNLYLQGKESLENLQAAESAAWAARSAARSAESAWAAEIEQEGLNISLLLALL